MADRARVITHVFFDIGGVLGSNGWDSEQRAGVMDLFGLDGEDFEYRHQETVGALEEGRMTLDEYLDITVFHEPRDFSREDFRNAMFAQSEASSRTIGIARDLARMSKVRLMTLNNESAELNIHRIEQFKLRDTFVAFLSSCWLGARKPSHLFYERALNIAQADPTQSVFVDDRRQNLAPAEALGMHTILYSDPTQLRADLRFFGLQL